MEKLLSILKYNKPNVNMLTAYIYHGDKNITLHTYSVVVTVMIKNKNKYGSCQPFPVLPRVHFIICHDYLYN